MLCSVYGLKSTYVFVCAVMEEVFTFTKCAIVSNRMVSFRVLLYIMRHILLFDYYKW